MIDVRDLEKEYTEEETPTRALRGVTFSVEKGEFISIMGPSGSGKSTLLQILSFLDRPTGGAYTFQGKSIDDMTDQELAHVRNKDMGFVFQSFNLLARLTVHDNVEVPLLYSDILPAKRRTFVEEAVRSVGLADKLHVEAGKLSGGQKQRVGIARALANHPKVLLSDEATSALDPQTTRSILELLADINRRLGITIILITHEMGVVRQIADRVAVIEGGRIIEEGSVVDVFTNPQAQTTRKFVQGLIAEAPVDLQRRSQQSGGSASCALLRLSFVGDAAGRPYISTVVRRFGVEANVLYGSIDRFKSAAFGTLFVELTGLARDVEEALTFLRSEGLGVEVIENVGPDAIRDAV